MGKGVRVRCVFGLLCLGAGLFCGCAAAEPGTELLHVSYDPTRELYRKLNRLFVAEYEARTGKRVRIRQSHGGSGSQARAVIDGLPADVLSLAMWSDMEAVRKKGLMASGWEDRLRNRSLPYTSTLVFVVRKGNPKGIHDWSDLRKPDVQIVTANPKTSGGAKLAFLAAWGWAMKTTGDEHFAREFVTQMYRQTPILDSGARGATITFAHKGIGDVQLTWENEALLELRELGDTVEIVYPSWSIRAEPHVAWVDANTAKRGTTELARDYLHFLEKEPAQQVILEEGFRPSEPQFLAEFLKRHPSAAKTRLFAITEIVPGGWDAAQQRFFVDGAIFDRIYQAPTEG